MLYMVKSYIVIVSQGAISWVYKIEWYDETMHEDFMVIINKKIEKAMEKIESEAEEETKQKLELYKSKVITLFEWMLDYADSNKFTNKEEIRVMTMDMIAQLTSSVVSAKEESFLDSFMKLIWKSKI